MAPTTQNEHIVWNEKQELRKCKYALLTTNNYTVVPQKWEGKMYKRFSHTLIILEGPWVNNLELGSMSLL